jgi:RNA polymerase sigma-70 factor (ECF subfamily)
MNRAPRGPDRESTFRSLYETVYPDLVRFVQRRARPDQVDDIVADTFLVVWRRLDDAPRAHDDARAWVFGVARNTLLNEHRGDQRRRALAVRLADPSSTVRGSPGTELATRRLDLARAWTRLSEVHQEALGLAVLDDLPAPQAAAVLGISPVAFRLRLSRARRALRLHLDHQSEPTGTSTTILDRSTAP